MNSSPRLQLRVLGGFALDRDGQPGKVPYEKGRALLVYLTMEPARTHTRASLAAMFRPDLAHNAALANLRQVKYHRQSRWLDFVSASKAHSKP